MLLDVDKYESYGLNPTDTAIEKRLEAVESFIRRHTNNNFQVRGVRFEAKTSGGVLLGEHPHIKVGDTVQITQNDLNEGVYTVRAVKDGVTALSSELFDTEFNRVTLVRYPEDVIRGAVGMIKYEDVRPKEKAGIASEALSRHSVSYAQMAEGNSLAGYPLEVISFLKPYMRAWF